MTFFKKAGDLILRSLDPTDPVGVKRVALLFCMIYWIISSFGITIIGSILSFIASKAQIEIVRIYAESTGKIVEYNFWMFAVLVGAITTTDFGKLMIAKQKVTAPDVVVEDGGQSTVVQNAETVTPADVVNAQNVTTVNTNSTTDNTKPEIDSIDKL